MRTLKDAMDPKTAESPATRSERRGHLFARFFFDGLSPRKGCGRTTTSTWGLLTETGNVTEYNDTGLINGLTYYYIVRGVNEVGEGKGVSVNGTPRRVPDAPENFQLIEGDGFVYLSWFRPVFNGGAPIINYTVFRGYSEGELSPIGHVNATEEQRNFSYTDREVVNGRVYYYAVAGVNEAGVGYLSEVLVGRPGWVPTAPRELEIIPYGNGSVKLMWEPPEDSGGLTITAYRIYRVRGEGSLRDGFLVEVGGDVYEYNDTDVENGKVYYYAVSAVNDAGEGPVAVSMGVVPFTVPTEPVNVRCEVLREERRVVLRWERPGSDGGDEIQGYRVYRSVDGESWEVAGEVLIEEYQEGLGAGERRYYYVVAVNDAGEGRRSEVVEVYYEFPPGAPLNLKVEVRGGGVYLKWEEPVQTGGGIGGYVIYRKEGGGDWKEIGRVNGTEFVDREIREGKVYYYRVCGVNSGGVGEGAEVKVEIEGGGGADWMWIIVVVAAGIGAGMGAWVFLRKRGGEGMSRKG